MCFNRASIFFLMAFAIMFLVKKNVYMVEFSGEKTGKEIFIEVLNCSRFGQNMTE